MKAIIFYCIDNFNDTYKYVVVCKENEVDFLIEREKSLSTEIDNYEIVDAFLFVN